MAPQKRKSSSGKPITSHPLFPAIVALWFGALFGLGSLAIRPSLLESAVVAIGLDGIVPAAAPPLGVTARILIALVLAALGALVGAKLAAWFARPKPVLKERKRKAGGAVSEEPEIAFRPRDAHPDAPARKPILAHEELGGESSPVEANGSGILAGRRRALAIEPDNTFELHELAPLPGGVPQILAPQAADADAADDALDLSSFGGTLSDQDIAEAPELHWPTDAAADQLQPEPERQMFRPTAASAEQEQALNFSPPADVVPGRQVFGMANPQPDHVLDQLGITDAHFEEIDAEAEEAANLHSDSHAPEQPAPTAAAELVSAAPASLGMSELAERLALSVRRRRERPLTAPVPPTDGSATTDDLAEAEAQPAAAADLDGQADNATDPQANDDLASPAPAGADQLPAEDSPAIAPYSVPRFEVPAFSAPEFPAPRLEETGPVAQAEPRGYQSVAAVEAPRPLFGPGGTSSFEQPPVSADPDPVVPSMPAALRPLSLDDPFDDAEIDYFLPPRRISMPTAAPASVAPPAADEPAAEAEPDAADDASYSSLLDLTQPAAPRQTFVRIEEPSDHADTIEPVVIFPGQLARQESAGSGDANAASAEPTPFRRFDAPSAAGPGQAVEMTPVLPQQDPDETERALRAALANLQRMSGAA